MKKRSDKPVTEEIIRIGLACLELLDQKKAESPVLMDLRKINSYLDFFIIATGNSTNHCRALAREVEKNLHEAGLKQFGKPDYNSEWIIMDFGTLIVHIFTEEMRNYYQLEKLWGDSVKYYHDGEKTEYGSEEYK